MLTISYHLMWFNKTFMLSRKNFTLVQWKNMLGIKFKQSLDTFRVLWFLTLLYRSQQKSHGVCHSCKRSVWLQAPDPCGSLPTNTNSLRKDSSLLWHASQSIWQGMCWAGSPWKCFSTADKYFLEKRLILHDRKLFTNLNKCTGLPFELIKRQIS